MLDLEDQLLERLANAPDDILSDIPLIEGLEATKKTSKEIQAALAEGAKVTAGISVAREVRRKQASEGAMLYFMLTRMCAVDHMYQYVVPRDVLPQEYPEGSQPRRSRTA